MSLITMHRLNCTKIVILILSVFIVDITGQRSTSNRGSCSQRHISALIRKSSCKPVEQPVPVPLPSGYVAVSPSVVIVTRCQNMACREWGFSCLPDPLYINNWTIPIYAHSNMGTRSCMMVDVEIHMGCFCGCSKLCGKNQVLVESICECRCDPVARSRCEEMKKLWDESTCSCVCPPSRLTQCSTGEMFIHELCRCESF